jgi:hypothetical protein
MSDLCVHCQGKGYHWKAFELQSHIDATPLADIYRRGENCIYCKGTGVDYKTNYRFIGEIIFIALLIALLMFFGQGYISP